MILWWKNKKRAKPVRGGRRVKRKCPDCGETTRFDECTVKQDISVYSVKLWDDEYRGFSCSSCGEVMSLEDTLEPALSASERQALERERQRELEAFRSDRERKKDELERQVDEELAALRRELGK